MASLSKHLLLCLLEGEMVLLVLLPPPVSVRGKYPVVLLMLAPPPVSNRIHCTLFVHPSKCAAEETSKELPLRVLAY